MIKIFKNFKFLFNKNTNKQELFPLTVEQEYMIQYELLQPNKDVYSLSICLKIENLKPEDLRIAVNKTLLWYKALSTRYVIKDNVIYQFFDAENQPLASVNDLSEEKFQKDKNSLIRPFSLFNEYLYRCEIFKTKTSTYLFFQVHHTIFDGTSFVIFFDSISKFLNGEEPEKDTYENYLRESLSYQSTPEKYSVDKDYFDNANNDTKFENKPVFSKETNHSINELVIKHLYVPIEKTQNNKIKEFCLSYNISKNVFMMTSMLLSLAKYNQAKNVMNAWVFNGRLEPQNRVAVGLLFKTLPIYLSISDDIKISDIFSNIKIQIFKDMKHYKYPYLKKNKQILIDDNMCVLYQKNIYDLTSAKNLDSTIQYTQIELQNKYEASYAIFDIEIIEKDENMNLSVSYNAGAYSENDINNFISIFIDTTNYLLNSSLNSYVSKYLEIN